MVFDPSADIAASAEEAKKQRIGRSTGTGADAVYFDAEGNPTKENPNVPVATDRTNAFLNSSLPALDTQSAVQQPGRDYASATESLKRTANDFKTLLGVSGDAMGANYDELLKRGGYGDTPEGKAKMDELQRQGRDINQISPEEQARIDKAGTGIGSQYDVLIRQAQEKGRQGRASNLTAAAKSGGLDASAWAGISSLVGVAAGGPEGFEGVGGKLAQMGSEYDAVVADLESKKIQAIEAAKAAERQAIVSGKTQDWERVTKLYGMAKEAYDDSTTMLMNKEKVLQSYQNYLKTGIEDARTSIKDLATSGIDISQFSDDEISQMEQEAGLPKGSFKAQYKTYLDEHIAAEQEKLLKTGKTLFDFAKDIEEGKEYKIPGTEITVRGVKQPKDKTVTELDMIVGGRTFKVGLDKQTGNELWRIDTGKVAKAPSGPQGKKFPESFSAWYEMTFGDAPEKGDKSAEEEYTRWIASGGAPGVEKRKQGFENPGGYTPQEVRRLRNAKIDLMDTKAADAFLYDKKTTDESSESSSSIDKLLEARAKAR